MRQIGIRTSKSIKGQWAYVNENLNIGRILKANPDLEPAVSAESVAKTIGISLVDLAYRLTDSPFISGLTMDLKRNYPEIYTKWLEWAEPVREKDLAARNERLIG